MYMRRFFWFYYLIIIIFGVYERDRNWRDKNVYYQGGNDLSFKLPKMELAIVCGIQSSKDAVFNTLAVKEIGGLDHHFINHLKRFCSIYVEIRTWR